MKGIVIRSIDYRETDKLVSIFTLDEGIVLAKFTGVRKEKAKLKAYTMPFTYADFLFNKKGDKLTVISADSVDNFATILTNYDKTICGYIVLDIIYSILMEGKSEQELFIYTLSTLKEIETNDEYLATIQFILKFIQHEGMGIQFDKLDNVFLDLHTAEFIGVRNEHSIQIDKKLYTILYDFSLGRNYQISKSFSRQILRLFWQIIEIKFNTDIKSFDLI